MKRPSFRMPESCVEVPLVVPAPSTRAQSQARNVLLKTCFRCSPKCGVDYLGAHGRDVPQREHGLHKPFCDFHLSCVSGTVLSRWFLNMNTKLFDQVRYFGTPRKDLFAQFILASIGFTLPGIIADDVVHVPWRLPLFFSSASHECCGACGNRSSQE